MKLLIAIVQDEDASRLVNALTDEGYSITKLATTGGFLRSGNTTLIMGVEDDMIEKAFSIIEKTCKTRKQITSAQPPIVGVPGAYTAFPMEVSVGGATVFVLQVDQFKKF